jgi:regulator of protease activity HflC (stomatin/prohibitin superfamily)
LRLNAEKEAEEFRLKAEKEAEELIQAAEQEKKELMKSIIEDYLSAFEKSQGRVSLRDETIEHFNTDVESQNKIDMDFLLEYLASRENVQLSGDN